MALAQRRSPFPAVQRTGMPAQPKVIVALYPQLIQLVHRNIAQNIATTQS